MLLWIQGRMRSTADGGLARKLLNGIIGQGTHFLSLANVPA